MKNFKSNILALLLVGCFAPCGLFAAGGEGSSGAVVSVNLEELSERVGNLEAQLQTWGEVDASASPEDLATACALVRDTLGRSSRSLRELDQNKTIAEAGEAIVAIMEQLAIQSRNDGIHGAERAEHNRLLNLVWAQVQQCLSKLEGIAARVDGLDKQLYGVGGDKDNPVEGTIAARLAAASDNAVRALAKAENNVTQIAELKEQIKELKNANQFPAAEVGVACVAGGAVASGASFVVPFIGSQAAWSSKKLLGLGVGALSLHGYRVLPKKLADRFEGSVGVAGWRGVAGYDFGRCAGSVAGYALATGGLLVAWKMVSSDSNDQA